MGKTDKIVVLENEIEAQLLGAELKTRNIPHLMRSYYDTAYDGLFQFSKGWGHVEAPVEFKDQILTILEDLRQGNPDSEHSRS
jgi:hypothetical protein